MFLGGHASVVQPTAIIDQMDVAITQRVDATCGVPIVAVNAKDCSKNGENKFTSRNIRNFSHYSNLLQHNGSSSQSNLFLATLFTIYTEISRTSSDVDLTLNGSRITRGS